MFIINLWIYKVFCLIIFIEPTYLQLFPLSAFIILFEAPVLSTHQLKPSSPGIGAETAQEDTIPTEPVETQVAKEGLFLVALFNKEETLVSPKSVPAVVLH